MTFSIFLVVHQISLKPLNGFVPNSQGGHDWFLARTSLNVKFKGQGHVIRDKKLVLALDHPRAATEWSHLLHAEVTLTFDLDIRGALHAEYVW